MCLAASARGVVGAWNGGWVGEEQAGPGMRQRGRGVPTMQMQMQMQAARRSLKQRGTVDGEGAHGSIEGVRSVVLVLGGRLVETSCGGE